MSHFHGVKTLLLSVAEGKKGPLAARLPMSICRASSSNIINEQFNSSGPVRKRSRSSVQKIRSGTRLLKNLASKTPVKYLQ